MYSVLVADDEPAARKHIETIIARKCPGYYVSGSVSNGGEALKKVRQLQPDVLITDIRMPVLNGIELVKPTLRKFLGQERSPRPAAPPLRELPKEHTAPRRPSAPPT